MRAGLGQAERLVKGKACVYATGSYGRGEASHYSDLDLFIVGRAKTDDEGAVRRSALSRLDEIVIKADLIELTRELKIEEFSGEGQYLKHYSIDELTKSLGTQSDDASNTLTARLLVLLEGSPLIGDEIFRELISDVISAYWRDYEDHKTSFMPAFLANDILRLWRTFCVNYEARSSREPEEKKAKGKLQNYKLKHSRMLTCYSALLMLLFHFCRKGTVPPDVALSVMSITPTERLEWLLQQSECVAAHNDIRNLLGKYEMFLQNTNAAEVELIKRFGEKDFVTRRFSEALEFGDSLSLALDKIGSGSRFFRLLVV